MCHYTQLIFVFLVKTGFHYVRHAGLELLTSGDLPASDPQSAKISVYSFARTSITKYYKLGGSSNRNLFSQSSGG